LFSTHHFHHDGSTHPKEPKIFTPLRIQTTTSSFPNPWKESKNSIKCRGAENDM
jgi:hypothetical protein